MTDYSPSHPDLALRPVTPADRDFLCALYRSTRLEELAVTGWPVEQVDAFLEQQFEAQSEHYSKHYPKAGFWILILNGHDVGRLYFEEKPDEFRIIDIALLPTHRSQGLGTSVLSDLLELAARHDKPLRIHVEENNPAQSLYQRLGFSKIDEHGIYHLMEACPQPATF